jgi:D-inositol-3-phosphate glycosyltransferase
MAGLSQDIRQGFKDSLLALPCDGLDAWQSLGGSCFHRTFRSIKRAVYERAATPLGARNATHSLYRAFLRYSSGGGVLLVPAPRSKVTLEKELDYLRRTGLVEAATRVCAPAEIRSLPRTARLHWFDPRGMGPEMFEFRQTCLRRPYPLTCTHHTISYRHELSTSILPLLLSQTLPCDSIVCTSRAARTAVLNLLELLGSRLPAGSVCYRGRVDTVPFGVSTDEFKPRDKRGCRRAFGFPQGATIFLYLGRISASDKADLLPLADAFRRAREGVAGRRMILVIAGNPRGSHTHLLHREIAMRGLGKSVRFVRHVTDADRQYLYGAADVFVSPSDSIQECFGLSILEAMACGVPQIASDWNGYRDLVVNGTTGFLVPTIWGACDSDIIRGETTACPEGWEIEHFRLGQSVCVDVDALAAKMAELVENPQLRIRMAEASRARATELFDWKSTVRLYEELWDELDAITSTLSPDLDWPPAPITPEYFRCFGHFAAVTVNEDSRIFIDANALHRNGRAAGALPYRGLFGSFDPYADWRLDGILEAVASAREPMRIRDIPVAAGCDWDEGAVFRQVMWLLKYGYLRLAGAS